MKNIPVLIVVLILFSFLSTAQTVTVGDPVGSKSDTYQLVGADNSKIYVLRMEKEKKKHYAFLESYSATKMIKDGSYAVNPSEIDPELSAIAGFYYCAKGPVVLYTTYDKKAEVKKLKASVFHNDHSWKSSTLITTDSAENDDHIIYHIKQNPDYSFLVYTEKQKGPRYNAPTTGHIQFDLFGKNLETLYSTAYDLEFKTIRYSGFAMDSQKNIYLFYFQTVLGINMKGFIRAFMINYGSGEAKAFKLWEHDKVGEDKMEFSEDDIKVYNDSTDQPVVIGTYYKINELPTNTRGVAVVRLDKHFNIISKTGFSWPPEILSSKDKYAPFLSIKSLKSTGNGNFVIMASKVYDYRDEFSDYRVMQTIVSVGTDLEKVKSSTIISRGVSMEKDTRDFYGSEYYYSFGKNYYCFYNQSIGKLRGTDLKVVKNLWEETATAVTTVDEHGQSTEKALDLKIGNDKECQIWVQEHVELSDGNFLSFITAGEQVYLVKINCNH